MCQKMKNYTCARENKLTPVLIFPGVCIIFHKAAVDLIPEMQWAKESIKCDADIRSMCSRGFAEAFYLVNP